MGLFDFVKDAGERVFGKDKEDDADDLSMMNALNQLAGDFDLTPHAGGITFDDGVASLTGSMPSQAEREKLVLLVGNTRGVAQVDDQLTVAAPPQAAPEPEAKMYTVQGGDSLSKIAKAQYGDASKYPVIFEANRPMLKDPNKIYPGQVLRIPAA